VGTTRLERLKKAQEATQVQLEIQDWFLLLEAEKGKQVP
jgi:predicted oxidoreductase